jgi:hypothetical protein
VQEGNHFRNHSLIIVTDTLPIYKMLCLRMKNALDCGVGVCSLVLSCLVSSVLTSLYKLYITSLSDIELVKTFPFIL